MERLLGAVLVFGIGANELLHAVFDGMDFSANVAFVGQVMSMSATADPESWRAIHNPAAAMIAYSLIWLAHLLSGAIALAGAWFLLTSGATGSIRAERAYSVSIAGVGIGAILYLVGFHTLAGGWFMLWSAPTPPNYLHDAALGFISYMAVIVYLMLLRRPVAT